jgi:DNA-binding LacI/PurR family transcriptional regulator
MHENGLCPGRDLAVCGVNDDGLAGYLIPSLTHIRRPDPAGYLKTCLAWMLERHGRDWSGPLCMQPRATNLFIGESTGGA